MCGIAGIISLDGASVSTADVVTMARSIAHRGPDGEGVWTAADDACVLGHRRLSIIDPDIRSNQPMLSGDGQSVIVYNGEIYNFLEIQDELTRKGHRFVTSSDTEVLLAAWREWGADMLHRLNGMWALAIYDVRSRALFLARDRFGVKPLLYAVQGSRLAFASEARAILALPWFEEAMDVQVARRMMFDPFSVEASERTLFKHMSRLPAGHFAWVRGGELTISRWWRTTDHLVDPPADMAKAAEAFRDRFFDAVKLRMRSDVAIGTCLSGGFDSSAVVAAMSAIAKGGMATAHRQADDWRHAFVATFPGLGHDESREAAIAARYAGIDPVMLDLSRDDGEECLDAVMETMEDPFIGLPTAVWKIYRAVSANGVRVSIDGHGADEMIGGYRAANHHLRFLMQNLLGNASGRSQFMMGINDRVKIAYLSRAGNNFLRGSRWSPPDPLEIAANGDRLPREWGLLNRRLYGMFHSTVLPTLLRNFDRLSMAHSVEVRMPFMDWRLVTYAMSLPDTMKADKTFSKLIAREAMRDRMPEEIRSARRKVGFGSQMPDWLNGGLGAWAERKLETAHPVFDDLVDRNGLRDRIRALSHRRAWDWNSTGRLWPYIALKWYLDRRAVI